MILSCEGVLRENLGQILEQVAVEATVIVQHTAQSRTLTYYTAGATTPNRALCARG